MPLRKTIQPEDGLSMDEVRLISDLRIMHSKVDELHYIVQKVKRRHSSQKVHRYTDPPVLVEDIQRMDEIYLWFVRLKEEADSEAKRAKRRA